MSSISLNRKFGKIEFPYRPILRLSFSAITDFASDVNGVSIIARDVTNEHIAEMKS